jgi:hypothetical protein
MDSVNAKLEALEVGQRRLPARVTRKAASVIGRKGAWFLFVGVMIGQLLGGAATPVVQKLVALLFGGH